MCPRALRWSAGGVPYGVPCGTAGARASHDPSSYVGRRCHRAESNTTARRNAKGRRRGMNKRKRGFSGGEQANWASMTGAQKLLTGLGYGSIWLPWKSQHFTGEVWKPPTLPSMESRCEH